MLNLEIVEEEFIRSHLKKRNVIQGRGKTKKITGGIYVIFRGLAFWF